MEIEMCEEFYLRVPKDEFDFKELNSSTENIYRNNNKIKTYCGEWVKVKRNDFLTHIVKPAENLESIAKKYSLTAEKLSYDNKLSSNKLFIGQVLKIYAEKKPH